jgi:hypothetical protein
MKLLLPLSFALIFSVSCTRKNSTVTIKTIPDSCINKITIIKKNISIDSNAIKTRNEIQPWKIVNIKINNDVHHFICGINGIVYQSKGEFLLNKNNIDSFKNITINSNIYTHNNKIYQYDFNKHQLSNLLTNSFVDSFYSIDKFSDFTSFSRPSRAKLIKIDNGYGFIVNYQPVKVINKNFIDTHPLIILYKKSYKKIGTYPKEFFTKRIEFNETFFDVDSSNYIYYAHESFDSIYKIDVNGKPIAQSVINPNIARAEFPSNKNGDMAFLRKFESESDRNLIINVWNNKYVIVIKKMSKEKILENNKYKLYIYDTNLNKLFCDIINEDIVPFLINSNKGVYFFTNGLKNIISYEIN